jgi:TonB family protein
VVQRVVRSHLSVFHRCYEAGVSVNANLEGRVVVKFIIESNGEVHSAVDGGSTMHDASVVECVVNHFRALSFPHPQPEGKTATVVYPMEFETGQ